MEVLVPDCVLLELMALVELLPNCPLVLELPLFTVPMEPLPDWLPELDEPEPQETSSRSVAC